MTMNMKLIPWLMIFSSVSAHALPTLRCDKVSRNSLGVTRVEFTQPLSSIGDFTRLVVRFANGASDEYETSSSTSIDAGTAEWPRHATFSNLNGPGLASLEYVFFTRPQDANPRGWSPKNGARMTLILPSAREAIRLICDKSL